MARTPMTSGQSRVWIIEGRARADREPEFFNFLKLMGIEKNFGSTNPIFEPSKSQYSSFDQTGEYRDEEERATTSMVGRYTLKNKSRLFELASRKCDHDIQLHMGSCSAPGVFNEFEKALILEGVTIDTYNTEDLGALEPGEQNKVDETGEVSAKKVYEFVPVKYAARSPSGVTNEILAAARCDDPSCGSCSSFSDGCQKILSVTKAAGGSPSTPADIIFTLDGGLNHYIHDIDTLDVSSDPSGVACVAGYAVVIAAVAGDEMHIVDTDDLNSTDDPVWTQVLTGYVAGGEPQAIDSVGNVAYIVGNGGYVYKLTDPPSGVSVIDAGVATIAVLLYVSMVSDEFAVAVGNDGAVITIDNDLVGTAPSSPVGIGTDLNAVLAMTEEEWFVGASDGTFYYTLNAGQTWTQITLPGTAPSAITDIVMSSDSILWVSATVSGKGQIFNSIDRGKSWTLTPRSASNAMPANDRINALVACPFDVDFIYGVGLADDATDGFIVVGSD